MNIFVRGTFSIELETGLKINPHIFTLLQWVEKTGSLRTAAKTLGVSYSHAWNTLYKINCQLNAPILITQRGGKGGGVAALTPQGEALLRQYERLCRDLETFLGTHRIKI